MKKFFALFAVFAMLIFALAACSDTNRHGGAGNGNGGNSGYPSQSGGGMGGVGSGTGGADGSITDSSGALGNGASVTSFRPNVDVEEGVFDGFNEAGNTTIYNGRGMTRFEMMLDNARVRDKDGDLFDGENAHHNTFF